MICLSTYLVIFLYLHPDVHRYLYLNLDLHL